MQEESKEEFLARYRKSNGISEELEELDVKQTSSIISKLLNWFYSILLLFFVWMIYQMFGMVKSN